MNTLFLRLDKQREDFKRLGVSGDWENPYVTLTPDYEAAQIRVFGEMANKGYIYRGAKPVYWSWSSESALAEAEIEYHDLVSTSLYYANKVKDGKGVLDTDTYYRRLDNNSIHHHSFSRFDSRCRY